MARRSPPRIRARSRGACPGRGPDRRRSRHPVPAPADPLGDLLQRRPHRARRVHQALATATDPGHDPDRHAWHPSEATAEPDEGVAAALERAADRATARGGWAASAAFLTRAAVLSPAPGTQARRLLGAARAEITAGAPGKAQLLLDRARGHLGDRLQDGLAKLAQGAIYRALNQPAQAAAVLLAAAADLAALDVRLARAAFLDALTAATVSGPLALAGATVPDVAAAARAVPLATGQAPAIGDLLLDADAALVLDGHRAAAPLVRTAITALRPGPNRHRCSTGSTPAAAWRALGDDAVMNALAGR